MKHTGLKNRLSLGILTLLAGVMLVTAFFISFMIYKQNRNDSYKSLETALANVRENLSEHGFGRRSLGRFQERVSRYGFKDPGLVTDILLNSEKKNPVKKNSVIKGENHE